LNKFVMDAAAGCFGGSSPECLTLQGWGLRGL
jgi:hypothetical protein